MMHISFRKNVLFVLSTICVCNLIIGSHCISLAETKALQDELFENYSTEIRPVINQQGTVKVNISASLLSINEFNELKGVLEITLRLSLSWIDEQLVWNTRVYPVRNMAVSQEKVWLPKLFLTNPSDEIKPFGSAHLKVMLQSAGNVFWSPLGIVRAACSPSVTNYPFDSKVCVLGLKPLGFLYPEVSFSAFGSISMTIFSENSEWEVGQALLVINDASESNPYPTAEVSLELKRRPLHFIVNVMAPIIMLVVLTPLVFLLPPSSGERVSYSITVLLSFSVYMTVVSANIPNSSLPVALISYYLLMCLSTSMIVVTLNIFQVRMYDRDDTTPVPRMILTFINFLRRFSKHRIRDNLTVKDRNTGSHETGNENIFHREVLRECTEQNTMSGLDFVERVGKQVDNTDVILPESKEGNNCQLKEHEGVLTWYTVASTLDMFYFCVTFFGGIILSCIFLIGTALIF